MVEIISGRGLMEVLAYINLAVNLAVQLKLLYRTNLYSVLQSLLYLQYVYT